MPNRREFIQGLGGGLLASGFAGISFAGAETESRLVVMILRGAVDGLAMIAPYGEPAYAGLRGELALAPPGNEKGVLKLDGLFGFHPSLVNLHRMYKDKQVIPFHAMATPYRERSHFDAQNLLENGTSRPGGSRSGWLNRALPGLKQRGEGEPAIAMSQNVPLILRGSASMTSWSPSVLPETDDDTLRRIEDLYAQDEFFAERFQQALESREIAGDDSVSRRRRRAQQTRETMRATAKFLKAKDGPRIAVIESGGWDTHANQGAADGNLARKFMDLDTGLEEFRREMGQQWSSAAILVVTEFGRTVKVNGTRGTDHGTAGAALLLGGAVKGGQLIADWPGLNASALYEGRDLRPTLDLRSVFKSVLIHHLDTPPSLVESTVFPDSKKAPALASLTV